MARTVLAIVPARGGSKGVPNKNLRLLGGKPLLLHICDTLRRTTGFEILVSTEDDQIAAVARLHGYNVAARPRELASDETPIGQVVTYHATGIGPVAVFQPTCPLFSPQTIRQARDEFERGDWHSLGFMARESHLLWDDHGPLYESRVNRQALNGQYRELGAFFTRHVPVGPETMDPLIGPKHCRFVVPEREALDIDTIDDLETARHRLARKRIEFRTAHGHAVGTGHARRCEQIAEELAHHDISTYQMGPLDLVVFDKLDTTVEEVAAAKARGSKVVCLEDLGPGSDLADLVVNELYDDRRPGVLSGPRWAVLRPEFCGLPPFEVRDKQPGMRVLVTFGGTDPSQLVERVVRVVGREACPVTIDPGENMASVMRSVDLVVSSAGRTAHEAAACGVPTITIAANERESRHSHCPGVVRLGLHATVSDETIQGTVARVLGSTQLRHEMSQTARAAVDGLGGRRIADRISSLLEGL